MNRKRLEFAFLVMVGAMYLHSGCVSASEGPGGEIRFTAAREEASWVGQETPLYLELWTNGFSFRDQWFVLPEVRGGYLLQPDSTTVKLSENRAGVPWQGLRYTLLFYPQRAGRLEIPSFEVRFSAAAGFGSEPAQFSRATPSLTLESRLPPGADGGGLVVTTTSFTLNTAWSPLPEEEGPMPLKAGDAVTLQVERRARDVPGMVFAPLPRPSLDGLGVYPETAQVNDQVNRGELTGVRVDTVTYVCEREGRYTIPELRFQWWDPGRQLLSEQVVPALELEVTGNPAFATSGASGRIQVGSWFSMKSLVGLLLLITAMAYFGPRAGRGIAAAWGRYRKEWEAGEAWAFSEVKNACDSDSAQAAYNAMTVWLGRWRTGRHGQTLTALAARSGNDELKNEVLKLQRCVAEGSAGEWRGGKLRKLLIELRKRPGQTLQRAEGLQSLNPQDIRTA